MTRVSGFASLSLAAFMLVACAALPDDAPVLEELDSETGATVTRLGHPVELFRETLTQDATGRFAFIAPFETNQMGTRELFLWVAVPVDSPADAEPPSVALNGKPLTLGAPGRAADFAGLRKSPYRIPTPWSLMYYYRIDATVIDALAQARDASVSVSEPTKEGVVRTQFAAPIGADPGLKEFAARP
jgi:hypothetical protein